MCTKTERYIFMAAACALLLAAFLPAVAFAGASVSDEAVARWRSDWRFRNYDFTEQDDEALFSAFEGEAFDGMTIESYMIESYTIRHYSEYRAAAVLRHADGSLYAYAMAQDENADWYIAEQTAALPQTEGVDRARVEYRRGLEIQLSRGDEWVCMFEFDGEPGSMSLRDFYCPDGAFASAYIPALRDVRFDDMGWASITDYEEDSQDVWIYADAEIVYHHDVFNADAFMEPDAFAIPFQNADLGALLETLGEITQSGITYIDEDATVWALAAREAAGLPLGVPVMPEPRDIPFALPEPVLAFFEPGQRFEVYTGPGKDYVREENGCASLSTDDWVLVFGEEDGWLMIAYRVSDGRVRFGWIEATQAQAGVSVPQLTWADEPIIIVDEVTNEPIDFYGDELIALGQGSLPGTMLGAFGNTWAYVQTIMPDQTPVRGFVSFTDYAYEQDEDAFAFVNVPAGESAPLYDAPGGEEIGRLYPGTTVTVKEGRDGMLHVVRYMHEDCGDPLCDCPSLDLSVRGWVDASLMTQDHEEEWWDYNDRVGYSALRVVVDANEDDTPEDIAEHGGARAYVLIAEADGRAYLWGTDDETLSITLPRSRLKETTRGVLCSPNGEESSEVTLYWCENGAEAVFTGEGDFVQYPTGMAVDVLMRAQGAALVCVHTSEELDGTYWVDGRNVIDVE